MTSRLSANLTLYPVFLAFTYEGFTNAVWYLYLYSFKGVPLEQMAWLLLLGDGVIVLFEVPTGWLADRLGRRRSMLAGIFMQIASMQLMIAGDSFAAYWLAMAICGLGDTLRSGADRALLYDSCLALGREPSYRPLLGRSLMFATLVMVATQILGGVAATRVSWYLPFWLDIGMSLVGLWAVLRMTEAPYAEGGEAGQEVAGQGAGMDRQAAGGVAMRWGVLALLGVATLTAIAPELTHFHLPAQLDGRIALTPEMLGVLYAAFELMQALGSKVGGWPRWQPPRSLLAGGAAAALLLAAMGSLEWAGIGVYLLARAGIDFVWGFAEPLLSEELNRRTASSVRATTLSVLNATRLLVPLSLLPVSTYAVENAGYPWMYAGAGAAVLIMLTALGWWWLRRERSGNALPVRA